MKEHEQILKNLIRNRSSNDPLDTHVMNLMVSNELPCQVFEDFDKFKDSHFCQRASNYLESILPRHNDRLRAKELLNHILSADLQGRVIWPSNTARNVAKLASGEEKKMIPKWVVDFITHYWCTYNYNNGSVYAAITEMRAKLRYAANHLKSRELKYIQEN